MLEIIYAGGWLMAPIILCSVIALAIIGERFWALRRSNVVPAGVGGVEVMASGLDLIACRSQA